MVLGDSTLESLTPNVNAPLEWREQSLLSDNYISRTCKSVRLNCFSVGWVLDFVLITACSGFYEKKKRNQNQRTCRLQLFQKPQRSDGSIKESVNNWQFDRQSFVIWHFQFCFEIRGYELVLWFWEITVMSPKNHPGNPRMSVAVSDNRPTLVWTLGSWVTYQKTYDPKKKEKKKLEWKCLTSIQKPWQEAKYKAKSHESMGEQNGVISYLAGNCRAEQSQVHLIIIKSELHIKCFYKTAGWSITKTLTPFFIFGFWLKLKCVTPDHQVLRIHQAATVEEPAASCFCM